MLEYYGEVRALHIFAVVLSGSLFFFRGIGLLLQQSWPKVTGLRYTTYAVDSVLLMAAVMLMVMLRVYPISHPWLTVKIICLMVYIALGIMAFRDGFPLLTRTVLWLSALLVYGFIVSVARAHHPLGFFVNLAG